MRVRRVLPAADVREHGAARLASADVVAHLRVAGRCAVRGSGAAGTVDRGAAAARALLLALVSSSSRAFSMSASSSVEPARAEPRVLPSHGQGSHAVSWRTLPTNATTNPTTVARTPTCM